MSRTEEVKQRLSPIMDRMKASLAKIQNLEASLNLTYLQPESCRMRKLDPRGNDDNREEETAVALAATTQSRRLLLRQNMGMIKKKLHNLQCMEELLEISEDRRQDLQLHFSQLLLDKPGIESASSRRSKKEQANQTLELDVEERQPKPNDLAIKCGKLECEVEILKILCDDLTTKLSVEGGRSDKLEQELKESQQQNRSSERCRSRPPLTIQSQHSSDCGSTEPTVSDNDSSTLDSYPTDHNDEQDREWDRCSSRMNMQEAVNSSFAKTEGLNRLPPISHPGKVSQKAASTSRLSEELKINSIAPENQTISSIEQLMVIVQTLERENRQIMLSQQDVRKKYIAAFEENSFQARRILELEEQLRRSQGQKTMQATCKTLTTPKAGRGAFLKRLLTSDTKQLK